MPELSARDDENDIDDDAEKKTKKKEEEEDDEDDEEDGDNNEGCPLQLCEKCKYIFLTKGHEENADPEAPIKSLLLSEGEKEEECKGKNTRESDAVFRVRELRGNVIFT